MRLYASVAPSWWPYQLVSMANRRLPPVGEPGFYRILVDNGMFGMYRRGQRPATDTWYHRLVVFLRDIERLRRPAEIWVILPDWFADPGYTLRAAAHPLARRLCRDYLCLAVAHRGRGLLGYAASAEQLASLGHVGGLAAPLKIDCSRLANGRRVIRRHCQAAIVQQVCTIAKRYGMGCHGLGALLSPEHLAALEAAGATSIDSSSWTRPANTAAARAGRWSAKSKEEREQYFMALLEKLTRGGVEIEGVEKILVDA